MFEKKFLEAVAERAVKTFAQTLVAALGVDAMGWLSADLKGAVSFALASTVMSVLTSFASNGVGKSGPALFGAETTDESITLVVEKIVEVSAKPAAKSTAKKTAAPKRTAK